MERIVCQIGILPRIPNHVLEAILFSEPEQQVFEIWNEVKWVDEQLRARASPVYDERGSWYDWVSVSFTGESGEETLVPGKVLAFFKNESGEIQAIVHCADFHTGRESSVGDTNLVQTSKLEFNRQGYPLLRSVAMDTIEAPIYAYEQVRYKQPLPPCVPRQADRSKHTVKVVHPINQWAKLFVEWCIPQHESQTLDN